MPYSVSEDAEDIARQYLRGRGVASGDIERAFAILRSPGDNNPEDLAQDARSGRRLTHAEAFALGRHLAGTNAKLRAEDFAARHPEVSRIRVI